MGWQCSKCKGPEASDGDEFRSIRNCDDETSLNLAFEFDPSLRRCPWSQLDQYTILCIKWYSDWRDYRILPYGSDRLDREPAFVYEAIDLATHTVRAIESDRVKKQRAELERQAKKGRRHGRH